MAAPPGPAPSPAPRKPVAAAFGTLEEHVFERTARIELHTEMRYGWRIKLPCIEPTRFRETVQFPKAGAWTGDRFSRDSKVSDDRTRAVIEEFSGCYDGWIQRAWTVHEGDPPGEYVWTVEVAGYQPQTFRCQFVAVE